MQYSLLLAIGAGLISAVVFASATTGPLAMSILLSLVTPLPIFLAGLAAGSRSAAIAGLAGTVLILTIGAGTAALIFAASQALPVVLLVHLASLNREAEGETEWYPIGRIVIAAALIAATLSMLTLFLLAGNEESVRGALRAMLEPFVKYVRDNMPEASDPGPGLIEQATDDAFALLPAVMALATSVTLLFNMWLAGRITLASGQLRRPWPDIAAMSYPTGTPLILAAATAAALLPGWVGRIATSFAGPLFLAYLLMGLAIVHYITRGQPWRPFALWALYAALVIMGSLASLALVVLGLAESVWPLRRMVRPPPRSPDS
jgi:hypothetical protein